MLIYKRWVVKKLSINHFELKLLNDLQERREISLDLLMEKYKKGLSTIKRNIENLNFYLSKDKQLKIYRGKVISTISYKDKIEFVQKLKINEYSLKKEERTAIILIQVFLNDYINLSKVYEEMGLSLTTKKKDSKYLRAYLNENNLAVKTIPRKGIKIYGDEGRFRILTAQRLISVIELDENDVIYSRQANNPIERKLFEFFKKSVEKSEEKNRKKIQEFIRNNNLNMDYASKKLLYIYYNLSLIRQKQNCCINIADKNHLPAANPYTIFPNKKENIFINYLIASLNYDKTIKFPQNENIRDITNFLITFIEDRINTKFYLKNKIFDAVYAYLYKSMLKNYLRYSFYDDKLDDTFRKYSKISNAILKKTDYLEKEYKIRLTVHQISSLTLIFETFLLNNRIFGENIKKIVIITNSSIEKINFFIQRLSHYLEFKMVTYLTINEIHKLKHIDYDFIITFSNRITSVLFQEFNIESLKTKFYFDYTDIQKFIDNGFTEAVNKKINKKEFLKKILKKDQDEIEAVLDEEYSEYFWSDL